MIELEERDVRLIRRIEKENCSRYDIIEHNDHYYINSDELLMMLEDVEDNREYAEQQLTEYIEKIEENSPLEYRIYKREYEAMCKENEELKEKIERIQSTLNEDDYDKLAMEGIEL